jgi:hypothetical protein
MRIRIQDLDPGSGSGMSNPDHISESLETIFWVKMLKFFDADPGWKKFDPEWKKLGSGINIPDPQHWLYSSFSFYFEEKEFMQNICCSPYYFLFCELFSV